MAEETALAGGEPDPNLPPDGEQDDPNVNDGQNQEEPEAVRQLAEKIGWTPRDQFKGDPEKWKPASEFIVASRDINQNLHREIRSMRDQIDRVTRTSAELAEGIKERTIAERDSYWKRVHADAVEQGKHDVADQAVGELTKLAVERQAKKSEPANDQPPETASFIEKNRAWFGAQGADGRFTGGDPLARARVFELCESLARQGVAPDEQLRQAERAIRKEFPEHFGTPAKQPAATMGARGRSADSGGSREKGYADMPPESRRMADDYERRLGIKKDDFAKSYWAEQAKRRVA